jgi:hypothetical protein
MPGATAVSPNSPQMILKMKIIVFWDVALYSSIRVLPKLRRNIELSFPERTVNNYQTIWPHIREDRTFCTYCLENLKSHMSMRMEILENKFISFH